MTKQHDGLLAKAAEGIPAYRAIVAEGHTAAIRRDLGWLVDQREALQAML